MSGLSELPFKVRLPVLMQRPLVAFPCKNPLTPVGANVDVIPYVDLTVLQPSSPVINVVT